MNRYKRLDVLRQCELSVAAEMIRHCTDVLTRGYTSVEGMSPAELAQQRATYKAEREQAVANLNMVANLLDPGVELAEDVAISEAADMPEVLVSTDAPERIVHALVRRAMPHFYDGE